MHGLLASPDFAWNSHIASPPVLDEINFGQVSSYRAIHWIRRGERPLFKIEARHYAICDVVRLVGGAEPETSKVWEAFREKNNSLSLNEHVARGAKYSAEPIQPGMDSKFGARLKVHLGFELRSRGKDPEAPHLSGSSR